MREPPLFRCQVRQKGNVGSVLELRLAGSSQKLDLGVLRHPPDDSARSSIPLRLRVLADLDLNGVAPLALRGAPTHLVAQSATPPAGGPTLL